MKLITWNLNGLEDKHLDERTEAAMFNLLLGSPIEKAMQPSFVLNSPDVIVLQEIVPRTFHAHITPHLQAAGFTVFPKEPTERSYFEVIASRLPISEFNYTPFDYSDQGRGLTSFTVKNQEAEIQIMTAHLESMKPGSAMRIDQSKQIIELMNQSQLPTIFAGDTNLRKKEWQGLDTGQVNDAWELFGSTKKHKNTWFSETAQARYDRVWTHKMTINNFELFGANKIPSIKESSSDHRAIRVEFTPKD